MTKEYAVEVDHMHCCGVREVGSFEGTGTKQGLTSWGTNGEFNAETFTDLLKQINKENEGYLLHIHFVKYKRHDGSFDPQWEWAGLRNLIRRMKGRKHLGEHINPNSGNLIDSYSWIAKGE